MKAPNKNLASLVEISVIIAHNSPKQLQAVYMTEEIYHTGNLPNCSVVRWETQIGIRFQDELCKSDTVYSDTDNGIYNVR